MNVFDQGVLGLSEKLTANLTVLASDDPYGVFIVSADNRPIVTPSAFIGEFISFCECFSWRSVKPADCVVFCLTCFILWSYSRLNWVSQKENLWY